MPAAVLELVRRDPFLALEIATTLAVLLGVAFAPRPLARLGSFLTRAAGRVARRPAVGIALVTVVAAAANLRAFQLFGAPRPSVHDEFAYLLIADTLAHGRLSNPPHPLARHFQTFHVIWEPRYMSKYPPASGALFAAGRLVAGTEAAGVLAGFVAMSGAIAWALFGLLPRRWALLASLLAVLRLGAFGYFANSYWGGAVAATGGALLVGGVARLRKRPSAVAALLSSLGVFLLAHARPFEGACVAAAVLLTLWKRLPEKAWRPSLVVLAVGLLGTVASVGAYNRATTGSATTMPYALHDARQVTKGRPFVWQPNQTAVIDDREMRKFAEIEGGSYRSDPRPANYVRLLLSKVGDGVSFFVGPLLLALLAFVPGRLRRRRLAPASAAFAGLVVGSAVIGVPLLPHYAAPAAAGIWTLLGAALAALAARPDRPRRVALAGGLVAGAILLGGVRAAGGPAVNGDPKFWSRLPATTAGGRAEVERQLVDRPGRDVVVVRYGPEHHVHAEWVWNAADIDESPVVWARDHGPEGLSDLAGRYPDRWIWLATPDRTGRLTLLRAPFASPP